MVTTAAATARRWEEAVVATRRGEEATTAAQHGEEVAVATWHGEQATAAARPGVTAAAAKMQRGGGGGSDQEAATCSNMTFCFAKFCFFFQHLSRFITFECQILKQYFYICPDLSNFGTIFFLILCQNCHICKKN